MRGICLCAGFEANLNRALADLMGDERNGLTKHYRVLSPDSHRADSSLHGFLGVLDLKSADTMLKVISIAHVRDGCWADHGSLQMAEASKY